MNTALLRDFRYGHAPCIPMDYLIVYPDCITAMPFSGFLSLLGTDPFTFDHSTGKRLIHETQPQQTDPLHRM